MSSRNAATIGTLVNAISGGLTSGQTYDFMRKITEDLDVVFTQVNTGPLPAVDGRALTHIDPSHIDSPGNVPQVVTSPGNVAFINWPNLFTEVQLIEEMVMPQWEIKWLGGTKKGRFGMVTDGAVIFTSNLYFDGANWQCDSGTSGSGFYLDGVGNIYFKQMQAGTIVNAMQIEAAKGNLVMDPASFSTPTLSNEIIYKNNRSIRSVNNANNALVQMMGMDTNDIIRVGADNAVGGTGHFAIPARSNANLPAGSANQNGTIAIDTTNNRICFWTGGNRYYAAGTLF